MNTQIPGLLRSGCAIVLLLASHVLNADTAPTEGSLRAADEKHRHILVTKDAPAQAAFMLPTYLVNAPTGHVLKRDDVVSMLASGAIGNAKLERVIEALAITDNVGVVMGYEIVTLTSQSDLSKLVGVKPVTRRFTNVYLFQGDGWRFLARHANVIQEKDTAPNEAKP
jgi:hypothetical protein